MIKYLLVDPETAEVVKELDAEPSVLMLRLLCGRVREYAANPTAAELKKLRDYQKVVQIYLNSHHPKVV